MKKFFCLAGLWAIISAILCADTYVKFKEHVGSFYVYGLNRPAMSEEMELWIGDKKMTYILGPRVLLVDTEKDTLSIMDNRTKTYVEAPLPFDPSQIFSEETLTQFLTRQLSCTVTPTKETKQIGKWNCKKHQIEEKMFYGGMYMHLVKYNVWATEDISDIPANFFDLFIQFERFRNPYFMTDAYIQEFKKISGFPILYEGVLHQHGAQRTYKFEATEIATKYPPEDIYTIPADYIRKEKLR